MAVPYIFGTLPAGEVPASHLDDDFAYLLAATTALTATVNIVVDTLADYEALTTVPSAVLIKGKTTPGDGWGGIFLTLPGDTTPADDAIYIRRTAGGDTAKRLYDEGIVNVMWFGAAPAPSGTDPTTDSSPAFLLASAAAPGGTCIVPAGTYLWDSAISIDTVCMFRGVGWNERTQDPTIDRIGTWILITNSGISPVTVTTVDAAGLGGFAGMAFEQDHPVPGGGWAPTAYPPIFTVGGTGGTLCFAELLFYNINKGILAPNAVGADGRIQFGRLQGQVFTYLFSGTTLLDQNQSSDIHVYPYWSADANVLAYQWTHADALVLGRCDGLVCTSLFANNCRTPVLLQNDGTGPPTGPPTNIRFGMIYADICKYGFWITGDNTTLFIDVLTSLGITITSSSGWRDDSAGSTVFVRAHNFSGAENHVGEQNSTTNGTTFHLVSLFAQEYNFSNGGYTAFFQAASNGGQHALHIALPTSIGTVTHAAAIINDTTGSGKPTNAFSIANLWQTNLNTVPALPSAGFGLGISSYVTDANATTFGSIVATGGANKVKIYSDQTNWRIG